MSFPLPSEKARSSFRTIRRQILGALLALGLICGVVFTLAALSMQRTMEEMHAAGDAFLASHPDHASVRSGIFSVASATAHPYANFVLIHGSPGGWADFGSYLADTGLTDRLHIVAPDRPGYGQSPDSTRPPSLSDQASRLAAWADGLPPGKRYWLGHSFGASVVGRLAIDRPDLVDGIILLAGAMDPQWEQPRWFHAVANAGPVRKSLPPPVSFANDEALAYSTDLKAMEDEWAMIECPVVIVHAKNDSLANFRHVAFMQERLPASQLTVIALEDGDHFLPWNRKPIVVEAMLRLTNLPTQP